MLMLTLARVYKFACQPLAFVYVRHSMVTPRHQLLAVEQQTIPFRPHLAEAEADHCFVGRLPTTTERGPEECRSQVLRKVVAPIAPDGAREQKHAPSVPRPVPHLSHRQATPVQSGLNA